MTQQIAIIDYGSGNLRSVEKALERTARDGAIAAKIHVTDDPEIIRKADRIVLPGVGAFGACMAGLSAKPGILEAMEHAVLAEARPFLGICVGMQLLADRGHEFGAHRGLGWIAGDITPLTGGDNALRIPHMGWNDITVNASGSLLEGLDGAAFYFAHSYYFVPENLPHAIAHCGYGVRFAAAVERDNICGVQFHPEKSQQAGLTLLNKFLRWSPN